MSYSIVLTDHYADLPSMVYTIHCELPDYATAYKFAQGAARAYGSRMEIEEIREPLSEGVRTIGYDIFSANYPKGTLVVGMDRDKQLKRQIRIEEAA